ncbi:MAG: tetratricopeptide repeat protein [Acidobacteriota bacterium]
MKRHPNKVLMVAMTCLMVIFLYGAKKAPDSRTEQLNFGVKMAQRGLWSEALFRFKQAHRLRPGDSRVLNNMAVAYEALGNFEKALDYYQDAIKSDPTNKDLKRNYSRFVEFYRAFKPAEDKKEVGQGSVIRPAGS